MKTPPYLRNDLREGTNGLIKVLVVDDSAFMRKSLSIMLESDPQIRVVGVASDGRQAIERIHELRPDIVTLDVEMPGMDGLTALRNIMRECPVPVLMVSSMTTEGAKTTMDALHLGAVDFISKDLSFVSVDIVKIKDDLIGKVKEIASSRFLRLRFELLRGKHNVSAPNAVRSIVREDRVRIPQRDYVAALVGVSTGGPLALLQVIPNLPKDFALPMVIAQHMPAHFTRTMAERLDSLSAVTVREAEHGERLEPGVVLVAPGGRHIALVRSGGTLRAEVSDEPRSALFRPSVDRMLTSAVEATTQPVLGVIMTGMGRDGLEGARLVKEAGGTIIAQDEQTCVVYGMPKAVVEHDLADAVLPLDRIPQALTRCAERQRIHESA